MFSLSQTSGYAILALSCLDGTERRWVLARDIAARTGVPRPYLSKILHALTGAKLIRAKRGYQGGFMLVRSARAVSVLDVVRAVDGDEWLDSCMLGLDVCSDARACPTHEFWKAERRKIRACLEQLSLKDVADFENRHGTQTPPTEPRPRVAALPSASAATPTRSSRSSRRAKRGDRKKKRTT